MPRRRLRSNPSNLIRVMPAKGGHISSRSSSWGIEPVPERLRVLGLADHGLLWGSLGVSLLVIVVGALLVPALSLRDALIAVGLGGLVGNAMLASAGLIGADARVPGMVLMRAPLGRVGSYAPTVLNALQCWGWATFELIIIAAAAAALSEELVGVGAQWFWTLVFGALAATLALLGPVSVVRRLIRRFAIYPVLASLAYLTWWALAEADFAALWSAAPEGGMTVWLGADLVIAITVSWMPLIPDYTRFSRDRLSAFWGPGLGYLAAGSWMLVLGIFLVLTRGLSDPAALPAAVVAAGLAAALAVLAVTVDEVDEAFANVYSSALSLQNLLPRVRQRFLVALVAVAATGAALAIDLRNYQSFLFLLGAFFVPLIGVLLAHWLLSGGHYTREDVFDAPAARPALLVSWLLGFAVYQWLHPIGPSWWVDAVDLLRPPTGGLDAVGVSIPSFIAAFLCAAAAEAVLSRRAAPSRT